MVFGITTTDIWNRGLTIEELREDNSDAYRVALSGAVVGAFGGCYSVTQLGVMVDQETIIGQAIALISNTDV